MSRKVNLVAEGLSGAVQLGLDYNKMADPGVRELRTAETGLRLEDVMFGETRGVSTAGGSRRLETTGF